MTNYQRKTDGAGLVFLPEVVQAVEQGCMGHQTED